MNVRPLRPPLAVELQSLILTQCATARAANAWQWVTRHRGTSKPSHVLYSAHAPGLANLVTPIPRDVVGTFSAEALRAASREDLNAGLVFLLAFAPHHPTTYSLLEAALQAWISAAEGDARADYSRVGNALFVNWKTQEPLLRDNIAGVATLPALLQNYEHLRGLWLDEATHLRRLGTEVTGLDRLWFLEINCCGLLEELGAFPVKARLHTLRLLGCNKLCELPESMKHLQALVTLILQDCLSLVSVGPELSWLRSLKHLELTDAVALEALLVDFTQLVHLHKLILSGSHGLMSLPTSLAHRPLQTISLCNLPNLFEVPTESLKSRQGCKLYVHACPKLPSW